MDDALQQKADFYAFEQYIACTQWYALKQFANETGVKILGDMPIYVSTDSVDVWSNRQLLSWISAPTGASAFRACRPITFPQTVSYGAPAV